MKMRENLREFVYFEASVSCHLADGRLGPSARTAGQPHRRTDRRRPELHCVPHYVRSGQQRTGASVPERGGVHTGGETNHHHGGRSAGAALGIQLTARLRSDQTKTARAFTPAANSIRVVCDDGTTLGSPAPCNGLKEFATHLQPATQVGQTGKGTFTIEWTPPATDVGEIIFYFAGNAANNSSSPTGDHIYTSSMVIRPACNGTVKPTITEIFDAASFRPAISSGQLISIKGTGYSSSSGVFVAYSSDLVAANSTPNWPASRSRSAASVLPCTPWWRRR